MKKPMPTPSVRKSLEKFGEDIRIARIRRNLTKELVAERAGLSLATLGKIEKGDPNAGIGRYAAVLFSLSLGTPFADLVDPKNDEAGLLPDLDNLPKRVRRKKADA
jgi:transcriptional regulator with XRE-family HTH domain